MKKKKSRLPLILVCVILFLTVSVSLNLAISGNEEREWTGVPALYRDELMQKGFPKDYADALTYLHLLHPTWEFVPLNVTDGNSDYTWEYVIEKETENPETSLIAPQEEYSAYRHPLNFITYDSGFYQASTKTVEYFMDPRSFFNEADLFQFYDLSKSETATAEAVDAVLYGTFMADAHLENGKTYTAYLLEIGAELGIDPVYLAVKLRQEQGSAGTSPIISGKCGTLLNRYYTEQTQFTEAGKNVKPPLLGQNDTDLLSLDGLYNPFNLKATGNGVFSIYKNAMLRAQTGTSSMQSAWGSPEWNTMWKGIYGGALLIKQNYIDRYQSTVYLQKFNVDARAGESRNFISQYMQNIAGSLTEGRLLYQSFAAINALDAPCSFLIPVYAGMPIKISPDPANGACTLYKPASARFETSVFLTSPIRAEAENETLFISASVPKYDPVLRLSGSFSHSYGILNLEYQWDGGEWISCATNGSLTLSLPCDQLSYGEHILLIRGEAAYDNSVGSRKQNRYFLGAVLTVNVLPPPSVDVTLKNGTETKTASYYEGDSISLPLPDGEHFAGWLGSDGSFLPSGATVTVTEDVTYTAFFLRIRALEGASLSYEEEPTLRFYAVVSEEDLQTAKSALPANSFRISACLIRNNTMLSPMPATVWEEVSRSASDGLVWRKLTADTPNLEQADFGDRFGVQFLAELTYTDGSTRAISANGFAGTRSVSQITYAALADSKHLYSQEQLAALQGFLS